MTMIHMQIIARTVESMQCCSYCVYRDLLNFLQTVETVSLQFNDLLEKNAAFSSFLHDEERESNEELFRTL